jgi:hypothetical protein
LASYFLNFLIQIEAMDYTYHLYKAELVLIDLIEVLQRKREEMLRIAYVNRAVTG